MTKSTFIIFLALSAIISAYGQQPAIELTFTAVNNAAYVQLDSIKVKNRTQGWDTVLYYPDTVLVLDNSVGITEVNFDNSGFKVFQNYPNPVENQTTITQYVPEQGKVDLMITDMLGRQVIHTGRMLDKGYHLFRFSPGIGDLFFFTAHWKEHSSSIKVLHSASVLHQASSLEYIGSDISSPQPKTTVAVQSFSFTPGDELTYIGYADNLQSGMLDSPSASENFVFQFATNIPCPGTPTITYEGQVYNTIQIFSQCWLKENLNVGEMIPGNQNQTNNNFIEKYCYNNHPDSCTKYGGLYQWNEMMQYAIQEGVQGICPSGWHIPTDEEWKVLEGAVDSQYGIGDPQWDNESFRGFDAGLNLKSTSGWYNNGNGTDLFGFSGLPGGERAVSYGYPSFGNITYYGEWWTSTDGISNSAFDHYLSRAYSGVGRDSYPSSKVYGFSVRCLRDN
jgi:uncharacterized protein (TIGR02145 family)